MSTPPFVDLPAGVTAARWSARGGEFAVHHTDPGRLVDDWVLLVPGFTGSKEDFIAVLPLLADAGLGAVAYDQRGQFETDGSADPRDYALSALAADLAAVAGCAADALGTSRPPRLVGHSFGGLVAQQAVIDDVVRPRSLVLMCTGPGALPASAHPDLERLRAAVAEVDLADIWPQLPAAGRPMSPAVAEFVERRWCANHPEHVREVARLLTVQPALTDQLRPAVATLPAAVVWGSADETWPAAGQRSWADAIGARAFELHGAGHSPNADEPARLVATLLAAWDD